MLFAHRALAPLEPLLSSELSIIPRDSPGIQDHLSRGSEKTLKIGLPGGRSRNDPGGALHLLRSLLKITLAFATGLAPGCAGTTGDLTPDESGLEKVFAYSTEGRPIRGIVLGEGPETYLCFGVIHGNEPAGGPLLERFVKHIEERPDIIDGKRVVVVPVLNPDGLERNSRTNSRGVDLNRNFPSRNWTPSPRHGDAPASERETRALLRILRQFQPTRILSIHSPLQCVNFDGPAEEIARHMARASGLPLRSSIGYETPGSLGSYAGDDLLVPTITLELPKSADGRELWRRIAGALEEFLTTPEPVTGK